MKVVINSTNEIEDLPLNKAMRLINKGKAHPLKEVIPIPEPKEIFKRKKKKEYIDESEVAEREEITSSDFSNWRDS